VTTSKKKKDTRHSYQRVISERKWEYSLKFEIKKRFERISDESYLGQPGAASTKGGSSFQSLVRKKKEDVKRKGTQKKGPGNSVNGGEKRQKRGDGG